jgi:hypothetical protein
VGELLAIFYTFRLEFAQVDSISKEGENLNILEGISMVKAFFSSKLTLSRESMGIKLDLEPK